MAYIPLSQRGSKPAPMPTGGGGNLLPQIMASIAHVESRGNYGAMGKANGKGQRAYGKYQIMDFNIPQWTKEALGRSLTPDEFIRNPDAQEKTAQFQMQRIFDKYGNADDVASVWFTGRPVAQNENDADATGTTANQYVAAVRSQLGLPANQHSSTFSSIVPTTGQGTVPGQYVPIAQRNQDIEEHPIVKTVRGLKDKFASIGGAIQSAVVPVANAEEEEVVEEPAAPAPNLAVETIKGIPEAAGNLAESVVDKTKQGLRMIGDAITGAPEPEPITLPGGTQMPAIDPTGAVAGTAKAGVKIAQKAAPIAREAFEAVPALLRRAAPDAKPIFANIMPAPGTMAATAALAAGGAAAAQAVIPDGSEVIPPPPLPVEGAAPVGAEEVVQEEQQAGKYQVSDRDVVVEEQEIPLIRNVLYSEISNREPEKQELEARTILNTAINRVIAHRERGNEVTIAEVLTAPNQYQGYDPDNQLPTLKGRESQYNIAKRGGEDVDKKRMAAIEKVINELMNGEFTDSTGGRVFYVHEDDGRITLDDRKLFK